MVHSSHSHDAASAVVVIKLRDKLKSLAPVAEALWDSILDFGDHLKEEELQFLVRWIITGWSWASAHTSGPSDHPHA